MNIKATVSREKRTYGSVLMWIIAVLCVAALALIVYNIIFQNYWYAISYFVGVILGASYILVCLNELYSTWIATDGDFLVMRCWDNCFFPYQTLYKFSLLGELLPAKNVRLRIPVGEISSIVIGTKLFIKRNTEDEAFLDALALYEKTKFNSTQRILEKIDIIYISTVDNESVFMSINHFDSKAIGKILTVLKRQNPSIDIKANGKAYRNLEL